MKTLRIYLALAVLLVLAACKKDSPTLPASELLLGQWKWYSQGLKLVSAEGETLEIYNQYYPPNAYIKFQSDNANQIVEVSEDGINKDTGPWELLEGNKLIHIVDTDFNILRLDNKYLIISYDLYDPGTQYTSRITFIFTR